MNPVLSPESTALANDATKELMAAREALASLLRDNAFRERLNKVLVCGPKDDLKRREREGKSHFKILYVSSNGFDAPLGTFLVLSIPHEAIGMPSFEKALKLHIRYTAPTDGFWKTRVVTNKAFLDILSACADPAQLEKLIFTAFEG